MKQSLSVTDELFLGEAERKLLPLFQGWFKEHLKNFIFLSLVKESKLYFSVRISGKIQMIYT